MKILAVDTSSTTASAAVIDGRKLLGEYTLNHRKTHSQKLMPMVNGLLRDLELLPEDMDAFAAALGPGSFTGLRIGIAAVKAMAFALKKNVIGVPTLDSLAYNTFKNDSLVCPIMDARNSQVYTSVYLWEGEKLSRITDYMGAHITELSSIIKEKGKRAVFAGDAVEVHRDFLLKELGDNCCFPPGNIQVHRASSTALLALSRAEDGQFDDCMSLVPFYLRKPQAEREFEKKSY